jgi:hypothetical protein
MEEVIEPLIETFQFYFCYLQPKAPWLSRYVKKDFLFLQEMRYTCRKHCVGYKQVPGVLSHLVPMEL